MGVPRPGVSTSKPFRLFFPARLDLSGRAGNVSAYRGTVLGGPDLLPAYRGTVLGGALPTPGGQA
ncbi:hypothetical protein GCM10025331_62340 [Actinoplanes utahensis]|nr:hypothetical protein Aut01nite_70880 [Actinoplanes utahensis]